MDEKISLKAVDLYSEACAARIAATFFVTLIQEAIESVKGTLIEELITVSIVVLIFLFHWRSALIILIQLPISVAAGFIFLQLFGISSNIMSLTGIALAIGVVVDDGIVMVENAYRHISEAQTKKIELSNKT